MYVPTYYRETDAGKILEFVRQNSFAALVNFDGANPIATHLPLLAERRTNDKIYLAGHISRANPQWKTFDSEKEILAIFTGAHAYLSPRWYDKPENHVPTWNYQAVHIYGKPRIISDGDEIFDLLKRSIETFEPENSTYKIETIVPEVISGLTKGIVCFEIEAARIEASFKLGQKLNDASYDGVITALNETGEENSRGIAAAMRELR